MATKKYTDKDAESDLKALHDSCVEGSTGDWDCSTDEGRKGFDDMIRITERLAKHIGVKL